ncbi:MAG: hypothetical protein KDK12_20495 [Rhodobacteraceae bacterium]|nr:hypothetical protein [Paracoccaceae bacterium]
MADTARPLTLVVLDRPELALPERAAALRASVAGAVGCLRAGDRLVVAAGTPLGSGLWALWWNAGGPATGATLHPVSFAVAVPAVEALAFAVRQGGLDDGRVLVLASGDCPDAAALDAAGDGQVVPPEGPPLIDGALLRALVPLPPGVSDPVEALRIAAFLVGVEAGDAVLATGASRVPLDAQVSRLAVLARSGESPRRSEALRATLAEMLTQTPADALWSVAQVLGPDAARWCAALPDGGLRARLEMLRDRPLWEVVLEWQGLARAGAMSDAFAGVLARARSAVARLGAEADDGA